MAEKIENTQTPTQGQENPTQEKQLPKDVKEKNGKKYTKDGLIDGIMRFTEFKPSSGDPAFADDGTPLNPGVFRRNPNGWDLKKACEWLHQRAGAGAQHVCAKFVRMAIEAGGLSTNGRPNWAWKYIDYLPTIGFKFIKVVQRGENFSPEPGDIAVYQKGGNPNVPGHICMWTGAEWASDFKQKNMIVYSSTNSAHIFRFQS